jgi:TIR domain
VSPAVRTLRVLPRWPGSGEQFETGWEWLSTVDALLEAIASRDDEGLNHAGPGALAGICEAVPVDVAAVLAVPLLGSGSLQETGRRPRDRDAFELRCVASVLGPMSEPPSLAVSTGEPVAAHVALALRDVVPASFAVEAPLALADDESAPAGWVVALGGGEGEGADADERVSRAHAVLEQVSWVFALALRAGAFGVESGGPGARWSRLPDDAFGLCARAIARSRPGQAMDRWRIDQKPPRPPRPQRPSPGPEPASRPIDDNVQFTVYRPRRIPPDTWCTILAFAHLAERRADAPADAPDPVEEMRRQAEQLLGDRAAAYADTTQDSGEAIPREGELTFVLDAPDLQVNPRQRSFRWLEDVHREEFRIRAPAALDGCTVRGALHVYLGALLLADVALAVRVDSGAAPAVPDTDADRARPYRRIFPSYSHRDEPIVRQVEAYARTMGDEYLRDVTHLRAGEVWNERLMDFIRSADVFQLFWSRHSMLSPWVRREWEYALSLGRAHFVRPTYWETPMPEAPERDLPPAPLRALHFQRLPVAEAAATESATTAAPLPRVDGIRPPGAPVDEGGGKGDAGRSVPPRAGEDDTVVGSAARHRWRSDARRPPAGRAPRPEPRVHRWRIPTSLAALLLIGVIGGALMWRAPLGTPPLPIPGGSAALQAVSPDGTMVVSMDDEGKLRIAPRGGGDAVVVKTTVQPAQVASLRFSADGRRIVCELRDGTVVQWDARTGARITAAASQTASYADGGGRSARIDALPGTAVSTASTTANTDL